MTNELGYYFYPVGQPDDPGHPQLDINIYGQPTGQHFDPVQVDLFVDRPDHGLEKLTISHPWSGPDELRVCPGRVTLHDLVGKVVIAFTFGGEMKIINRGTYTSCELTSPAPIIHMMEGQEIRTVLVTEFEGVLARRRAEWAGNETGFETRLAQAEPFTLFVVGLVTLKEHLQQVPSQLRGDSYQQASHVINQAIRLVQENGHWPASLPMLADLL